MSAPAREPLVIRSLEFLGGMASAGGWRPEPTMPEVAFAGRSNVGKSSLLNRLVHRRKLARVSNTPGRTREVNFFRVNDRFVLVDRQLRIRGYYHGNDPADLSRLVADAGRLRADPSA